MKARVLLVEDNPVLQAELTESLEAFFDVVAVRATAADALAWLHANRDGWDIAVLDIFLREGNGFQVLRQCAGRDAAQSVVVLSNYTREPARSSALNLGADAVYDKGFEMDAFLAWCDAQARAHAAAPGGACTPAMQARTRSRCLDLHGG